MNKFFISIAVLFFSSLPLQAVEKETVVLREWNKGKNIEYLEYTMNNRRGNLCTYTIRSVYGEMQMSGDGEIYDTTINKYLLNCKDKIYRLNKTYFLNGEDFVTFKKYDDVYYNDKTQKGWEKVNISEVQKKVSEILCE